MSMIKKLDYKEKEVEKINLARKECESMLRRQNKEHSEHARDLDAQIKAFNKAAKSQDKEIYNLGKSLQNHKRF